MDAPREEPPAMMGPEDAKLLGVLVLFCGSLLAIGMTAAQVFGQKPAVSAIVLGDVSEAYIVEIRDERGTAVLTGEFRSRVDSIGNTERDAELRDGRDRRVIGEIEIETPAPNRPNRRPELEVDIMGLPPRQRFAVVIDDRTVGTFMSDDRGSVDLELQEGEMPAGGPASQ